MPHTEYLQRGERSRTSRCRPACGGCVPRYFRGVGWYARSLEIPAARAGPLGFHPVRGGPEVAAVYLNGQMVGGHRGLFTAFCLELTAGLKFGAQNDLRVRVNNALNRGSAPVRGFQHRRGHLPAGAPHRDRPGLCDAARARLAGGFPHHADPGGAGSPGGGPHAPFQRLGAGRRGRAGRGNQGTPPARRSRPSGATWSRRPQRQPSPSCRG